MVARAWKYGSSLFLCGFGDHRDLHSFPTRRSSDLSRSRMTGSVMVPWRRSLPTGLPNSCSVLELGKRSEEHTSELQSQFHLVCRLLLEKKNKDKQDQQFHKPSVIKEARA